MITEKFEINSMTFTIREISPDSFKATVEYDFMKPYKYKEDETEFKKALLFMQKPVMANLSTSRLMVLKFLEHVSNI